MLLYYQEIQQMHLQDKWHSKSRTVNPYKFEKDKCTELLNYIICWLWRAAKLKNKCFPKFMMPTELHVENKPDKYTLLLTVKHNGENRKAHQYQPMLYLQTVFDFKVTVKTQTNQKWTGALYWQTVSLSVMNQHTRERTGAWKSSHRTKTGVA